MAMPGRFVSRNPRSRAGWPIRPSMPIGPVMALGVALLATGTAGCRSGASAMSAPSWWSFSGKTPDADKLSAAPPFAGDVKKPSESATPYPTTSAPNAYSMADAAAGQSPAQPAGPSPAAEPTAITYGTRPEIPAATTMAAGTVTPPPARVADVPPSLQPSSPQIAPQVGPYAGLANASPSAAAASAAPPPASAAPTVPFASAPPAPAMSPAAAGGFPATAGYEPAAPGRFADPPVGAAATGATPPPLATETLTPPTRYASASGSRFGGSVPATGGAAMVPPAPAASPTWQATPAASSPPPVTSPLPSAPPLPGAPPLPTPPANAPPRRPDPGYRPGGTSSYRPTRAILVDTAPASAPVVQPASFEEELPAGR